MKNKQKLKPKVGHQFMGALDNPYICTICETPQHLHYPYKGIKKR